MIADGDMEAAEIAAKGAVVALDKAAQKGSIHPNNAARRKSRLIHRQKKAASNSKSWLHVFLHDR